MMQLSSPTAGGAQYAVSATGNNQRESQAENIQSLCTPTCSTNGTHSDGYTGAFEGPEKLLEMWFAADAGMAHHVGSDAHISSDEWAEHRTGLRLVPRTVWSDMLDMVHCQVLSTLSNAHIDSYLLSESSFFVYPHKLVLKTCGTTTLLYAIPRILSIAREHLGAMCAHQVFYSRKNFMYPDQQEELHQSWAKEVAYLDALFPDGAAYLIGKTNRDHWHVYLSGPESETVSNSLAGSPVLCPQMSRSSSQSTVHGMMQPSTSSDITVEILMTGLDAERMRLMYLGGASTEEGAAGGAAVERLSGISDIYPNAATDSYLFTPCGFSLNGLQGDGYFTIHVTPEPHCSYASFETNVSGSGVRNLHDPQATKHLVEQVTRVFGPKFVTVTVFKARAAEAPQSVADNAWENGVKDGPAKTADAAPLSFAPVDGYKAMDRVLYEFDHYWLRYAYYIRAD
ncbi:spermidine resistance protein [Coemansia sp. RSA 2523]|nr:spermidine resistance protein [Coemansia sp. RSA 1824]KAJ1810603.1 spermidine resistance protein [Coemansia sp. RSA 2523]KAJ2429531.1 spermidine resistance protein [Coemansia sp. RSA 2524]